MTQERERKRFDDSETRSKTELIADLQAHRVELEMQNYELREAQQQLEETRDRYAVLYDYAPVGYFTLDKSGRVLEINLTGSTMLGVERAHLVGQPFITHVAEGDIHAFLQHLHDIFHTSGNIVTELRIKIRGGKARFVRLESSVVSGGAGGRTVMTDIDQLKDVARRNLELLRENRQLTQSMFKLQEEERRHLARELHDELGQWLTAIYAEAKAIANSASPDSAIHAGAQAISDSVGKMHDVVHDLLHQLRPALLDMLGLADSLRELKKQWCAHHPETSCELALEGEFEGLGETVNITIYRIVQEALNNIASHAHATRAQLRLSRKRDARDMTDTLWLSVEDNGRGYNPEQRLGGLGLLGMRERAIAAGGEFSSRSAPGHGTHIDVRLPLKQPEQPAKRRKSDA
ncbi:MAG: histidine kinase [Nitrosospira sp.]|nr:histidine kinase [Nitrosospira sp.]